MESILDKFASSPIGAFAVLAFAAFLEVMGDACFQSGLYKSSGGTRAMWLLAGVLILATYGVFVNLPRWDFGRLLGVYVVLFFVMAQIINKVRFGQAPTPPIYAGGGLIVAGGLLMAFWKG